MVFSVGGVGVKSLRRVEISVVDGEEELTLISWSISSRHGMWIDLHREVNGGGAGCGSGRGGGLGESVGGGRPVVRILAAYT